jgi:CBS domain-containing protein
MAAARALWNVRNSDPLPDLTRYRGCTPSHQRSEEDRMIVKTILAAKGTEVVTIDPNTNVAAAARLLSQRRIGAVVVTGADQRVVGILSERDIVRVLAERGNAALELPLTEAMTRKVITCAPADSISSIMERMTQGKFRHLPVLEQGKLTGIISIGDVVKWRLQEMESEQNALRDYIQTA